MRFGVAFGMVTPPHSGQTWRAAVHDLIRDARRVEELGYDSLHVVEHHFQPDGYNPSPLMTLAAVAPLTERLRLWTNILLVPLYNPVKLAEDVAVLDNISDGRVTLGVAPGYVVEEFAGMMVPYKERFRRFEEAIDLMQLAWSSESFAFEGEFFRAPETTLTPRPIQRPHPPIAYGVSGPRLLQRAAKRGVVLTGSPRHTVPELREHYSAYESGLAEHGHVVADRPVMREVFLAETQEAAEALAAPAVDHLFTELYGQKSATGERILRSDDGKPIEDKHQVSFETFKDRYIIGTPDLAHARLEELRDAIGVTEVICWTHLPGVRGDDAMKSIELFAREVMPAWSAASRT